MKIFISWAKDSSKAIALELHRWIPAVTMRQISTWCSADPKCLPAGSGFGANILDAAKSCEACLVILTKENLSGWWVNFEAGLFIGQGKKVYAILCGDLTYQTLGQHNHPLSVAGVNYTFIEENSLVAFLLSLKTGDKDWEQIDFQNAVAANSGIIEKYNNIFDSNYKNISSSLAASFDDAEIDVKP